MEESERAALEARATELERREDQLRGRALELECLADALARREEVLLELQVHWFLCVCRCLFVVRFLSFCYSKEFVCRC